MMRCNQYDVLGVFGAMQRCRRSAMRRERGGVPIKIAQAREQSPRRFMRETKTRVRIETEHYYTTVL